MFSQPAFLFFFVLLMTTHSPAVGGQSYPEWFLKPSDSSCRNVSVSVMAPSYSRDSLALAVGYSEAIRQLTRLTKYTAVLQNLYVGIEAGTIWMDFTYHEEFDSALFKSLHQSFSVSSFLFSNNLSLVGAGRDSCSENRMINVRLMPQPEWIKIRPEMDGYLTGIGMSVKYFNEHSSWNRALDEALKDLLKQVYARSSVLVKKSDGVLETIAHEEFEAKLYGITVEGRYYDYRNNLYYTYIKVKQ